MKVSEDVIARIVGEAATRMQEPDFISTQVTRLAARQPAIMHYVVAHENELSVDCIVQVMFQVALVQRSVTAATGQAPPIVDFKRLDAAASSTPTLEALAEDEPDLASFIHTNLDFAEKPPEREVAAKLLAHIARALLGA